MYDENAVKLSIYGDFLKDDIKVAMNFSFEENQF